MGKHTAARRLHTEKMRRLALPDPADFPECATCGYGNWTESVTGTVRPWSYLDVAHITPNASGGDNDPGNLMILCRECHADAPNTTSRGAFLEWVDRRRESDLGPGKSELRALRAVVELPEFARVDDLRKRVGRDRWNALFQKAKDEAVERLKPVRHYGHPRWNYETTRTLLIEITRETVRLCEEEGITHD